METSPDRTRRSGGHARSGPLLRARDADLAPRHAGPAGHLASSSGVRGRPRDRSRAWFGALTATAVTLAVAALVGGRQHVLDEPEPAPPPPRANTAADQTPASARAALEQLLASRAVVTTRLLRATLSDDEPMASAADTVLARITADAGEVAGAWRGQSVAGELAAVLGAQSAAAVAYARALRDEDDVAVRRSLTELEGSSADLGGWLNRTTDGDVQARYPQEDGGMLRAYTEAELRGDRAEAAKYERALQLRMSREGGTLATTIAGRAPVESFEQRQRIERWQLLFGEHAVIAGEAVRAQVTAPNDARAALAALADNARGLTALVSEVLPAEQERAFADLWQERVEAVVDLARAAAAADEPGRPATAARLTDTAEALGTLLDEASRGRLDEDVTRAALQEHADSLGRQADAWAAGVSAWQAYTLVIGDHSALTRLGASTASALGAADREG